MSGNYNEVKPRALRKKSRNTKKQFVPPLQPPAQDLAAWPPTLQEFVNRSFLRSESLSEPQKAQFGGQIQSLMQLAIAQNKVWTNPWQLQQLPVFNPEVPLDLVENTVQQRPPKRLGGKYDSDERKLKRMARFSDSFRKSSPSPSPGPSNGPVVGYLTALEKRYLRLTSEPDPAVVRPQSVLEQSLKFVVNKYETENAGYLYINDQLKAIRQDLTVQHIKNDITIKVYKTHGRLAIINNDLGEFNQCSSQLKQLYSQTSNIKDTFEFMCYRVLYLLLTGNYSEVNVISLDLLRTDKEENAKHLDEEHAIYRKGLYQSLELLTAMTLGDYHGLFKTYQQFRLTPQMTYAYHLMKNSLVTKQRLLAINTMCKAFKKLPLDYLTSELAFDPSEPLVDFLKSHNLGQFHSVNDFDCAAARPVLQAMVDKGNFRKVDIKGQV